MGYSGRSVEMTVEYAKLLHLIATNTEFRSALEEDPVAALATLGIEVDPRAIPDDVVLPSMEEAQAGFGEALDLFAQGSAAMFNPPCKPFFG